MRMRRALGLLLALASGAACAGLVACGSSDNPHLLSPARADRLTQQLDAVQSAVDDHDCQAASEGVQKLEDEINSLPRDTDPQLQQTLQEGTTNLRAKAADECQQTETQPTVTETTTQETQTETQPTTQTETQTTKTETTPTTTTTTPTTTTTTPTTTTPDSGGSTPPPGG